MKLLRYLAFTSALLAVVFNLAQAIPVSASSVSAPKPKPTLSTSMTLSAPGTVYQNSPFSVNGVLTSADGKGVGNVDITISLDGSYLGLTSTAGDGNFQFTISVSLSIGSHTIDASFQGNPHFNPSSASTGVSVQAPPPPTPTPVVPTSTVAPTDGVPPTPTSSIVPSATTTDTGGGLVQATSTPPAGGNPTGTGGFISSTSIVLADPGNIYENKDFTFHGVLKDIYGYAIPGKDVYASMDGNQVARVQTNPDGTFQMTVSKDAPVGFHTLDVSFPGARLYYPTDTSLTINIQPGVSLNLDSINPSILGEPFVFTGMLVDLSTGNGIPNATVAFSVDGLSMSQTHTNELGLFKMTVNKDLDAGAHDMVAQFNGAPQLAPAKASGSFKILPFAVKVQTVPSVPGVTFQMDGRQFVSGANGIATLDINKVGTYRLEVLIDQYHNLSQRIEFGRWEEESYQPYRDVRVPSESLVQVGLNVYHQMAMNFVDLDGIPVDPRRITGILIRSAQGDVFSLTPDQSPWLPASRTDRRQIGLEETDLQYSIINVTIDGSNVVNSAQQRFYVKPNDVWKISLLLYSLYISPRDGLFGSSIGKSVNITSPDGLVTSYQLSDIGTLELHSLARGIYHLELKGASGMGTSMPVALSRNQVVNMNILTRQDIIIVGLIGLAGAIGIILYGRPWLIRPSIKKKRLPVRKEGTPASHEI